MKKYYFILIIFILDCQVQKTNNINDLSDYNYSVVTGYPNFEPSISDARNVYIHFSGTQYVFNLKFEFVKSDSIALADCLLLEFDDTVNVDEWIDRHHFDVTNMYTFIDPISYVCYEHQMNLQVLNVASRRAFFSVSFENVRFEQCDRFISFIAFDSLQLEDYDFFYVGTADSIAFWAPPSGMSDVIDSRSNYPVKIQVLDENGRKVDSSYTVKCVSIKPDFGIISDSIKETDTSGLVTFNAVVTNGDLRDTFPLVASLTTKPTVTDTAFMVVGGPCDRLWIFYNDTAEYDPEAEITACLGDRVPVIVRASTNGTSISTKRNTSFTIAFEGDLAAYETETSTEKITTSQLIDGQVTIWIEANGENVTDGQINLTSNDMKVDSADRGNINFEACLP